MLERVNSIIFWNQQCHYSGLYRSLEFFLCAGATGFHESLSTAIQGLVEKCARRSRVISQDFERFPASDGFCREYQIPQLSCGLFLAGRAEARVKTVRTVLADCCHPCGSLLCCSKESLRFG